ncbi:MAG: GNAT family N-acetyltransferase [Patescibacteria group bacterium]
MAEQNKKFTVRPAALADSRRIWEIRNNPRVRRYANNSEKISWEKHSLWFKKKYFSNSRNYCLVLVDNNQDYVVGYCRFDFTVKENKHFVSIAINQDNQGRGLGSLLLSQSIKMCPGVKEIIAEIRKNNPTSLKFFQRNNFKLYEKAGKNIIFGLKK